jgi:predicted nucleic-acid-binding Zn-ribbon protein
LANQCQQSKTDRIRFTAITSNNFYDVYPLLCQYSKIYRMASASLGQQRKDFYRGGRECGEAALPPPFQILLFPDTERPPPGGQEAEVILE